MDISPEERLLAIIKEQDKKAGPSDTGKKKKFANVSEIFRGRFLKNNLPCSNILKSVNKYLMALLAILIIYLIYDILFARPYKDIGTLISRENGAKENAVRGAKKETSSNMKEYSYYINEISGKQIFGQPVRAEESASAVAAVSDDASANFGLAGIVAGNNPQVIVQNKKNEKVYYLNKGDSLDGYIVEEISKNKVVLDRDGKKTTLFL
jgi:type II secretory pathway component PulC